MQFYTNVIPLGDKICVRGYEDGRAFNRKIDFYPTLYVPSKKDSSKWRTLEGTVIDELKPGTIKETREFVKRYDGVERFDIYGNTNYIQFRLFQFVSIGFLFRKGVEWCHVIQLGYF